MSEALLILSEDAVFARMLELEFRMQRISVRVAPKGSDKETARVILVDLDTSLPPVGCEGRVIGFTRSFSVLASDPERRCSMILHRPFSNERLCEEVQTLLEAADSIPRERMGRDVLALREGALVFGERSLPLSPTEEKLMEAFLTEAPHALTRERISALIGKSAANKPEVYVCFLRKKLQELTGRPMIRTVRGVGYRLEP